MNRPPTPAAPPTAPIPRPSATPPVAPGALALLALGLALAASLGVGFAAPGGTAPGDSAAGGAAPDEPVLKIQATAGDSLLPAETEAVKKTLGDYLDALQHKDYARAGGFIERASFLASAEEMLLTMVTDSTGTDSTRLGPTRRKLFGVSTRDSLALRPTGELFAAFMRYMDATNPGANATLASATIQVLAARRMRGVVHVAYQLTLGPTPDRPEPYTQVTAQKMTLVDGRWLILVGD